jgi:hypothetical protein
MPENITWGGREYKIVGPNHLEALPLYPGTEAQWRQEVAPQLLGRIATALSELRATDFLSSDDYNAQLKRANQFVNTEATRQTSTAPRELDDHSRLLTDRYLGMDQGILELDDELERLRDAVEDAWIFETVRSCYPDEAAQIDLDYQSDAERSVTDRWDAYHNLYEQCVSNFSFASINGLQLAYLNHLKTLITNLDPESQLLGEIDSNVEALRHAAARRQISPEEFDRIRFLAIRDIPVDFSAILQRNEAT